MQVGLSAIIYPSIRTPGCSLKTMFSPIMCIGYAESYSLSPSIEVITKSFKDQSDAYVCVFVPVQCGSGQTIAQSKHSSLIATEPIHVVATSLCKELNVFGMLFNVRSYALKFLRIYFSV